MITNKDFVEIQQAINGEASNLTQAGQKEYARDGGNALANFDRIAEMLNIPGVTPEVVLLVYFLKHVDGILSYVGGHKSQRESVKGRIFDCRNYLDLLFAMVLRQEGWESGQAVNGSHGAPEGPTSSFKALSVVAAKMAGLTQAELEEEV